MISVVVPVYNVEKYLERCVRSILNQTYKDLEIILVDDGATDSSGSMCDKYAKEDPRIKVIHKENGGLSDARNFGTKAATGDYIIFIDSDDYIEPDMMELLITIICDADMSVCGFFEDYSSGSYPRYKGEEKNFEADGETTFKIMLDGKMMAANVCHKMLKASIAKQIAFPKGRLFEDVFYFNKAIPFIKKVRISTNPKYHYIHRKGSITTASFSRGQMDIIDGYKEALQVVKDLFPSIIEYGEFRVFWAYFYTLDHILLLDNYKSVPEYSTIVSYLKKNAFKISKNKCFAKSRRIAALILKCNVRLYRMLALRHESKKLYD